MSSKQEWVKIELDKRLQKLKNDFQEAGCEYKRYKESEKMYRRLRIQMKKKLQLCAIETVSGCVKDIRLQEILRQLKYDLKFDDDHTEDLYKATKRILDEKRNF